MKKCMVVLVLASSSTDDEEDPANGWRTKRGK